MCDTVSFIISIEFALRAICHRQQQTNLQSINNSIEFGMTNSRASKVVVNKISICKHVDLIECVSGCNRLVAKIMETVSIVWRRAKTRCSLHVL